MRLTTSNQNSRAAVNPTVDIATIEAAGVSALVSVPVSGGLVCESDPCIGIDIKAAIEAPAGEGLRIKIDLFRQDALGFRILQSALGALEPVLVSEGQGMPVRHDAAHAPVILSPVPDEADNPDLHGGGHG